MVLPFALATEAVRGGVPDAVLAALPHNGGAAAAMIFARAVGAASIVDVHDTWPESLQGVTPARGARAAPFALWKWLADVAYRRADHVFAESFRYAQRADAARSNPRLSRAVPIYLGGDLDYYRAIPAASTLPPEIAGARFLVAYAGTLGRNYDLDCVLEAFQSFSTNVRDAGLLLLGAGEREDELRTQLTSRNVPAWVSGRLPHSTLLGYLKRAHVGLNAFRAGGNVAYSYKLNDYLLAGVPVVSSLSGESAEMIERNRLGFTYQAGNAESLEDALQRVRVSWLADPEWPARIQAFAAVVLDRSRSYAPLIEACLGPASPQVDTLGPHQ
jgi:glycosyltransferase involved in cell wall biosynthesis